MKLRASLSGMEYFSLLSIPSSKIAVALHWMFLGNLSTALTQTGERTNTSITIKRPTELLLKYLRDIIASSAEYLGRSRRAAGESYDRHPRGLSPIYNLPTEDCREVRACPQTHCPFASAHNVKKVCLTPKRRCDVPVRFPRVPIRRNYHCSTISAWCLIRHGPCRSQRHPRLPAPSRLGRSPLCPSPNHFF